MDCLPHIHLAAIHSEAGYRSATLGVGVLCRENDVLAGTGIYRNSIGMTSRYAAVGLQPFRIGGWRLGAVAGVVTGYGPTRPLAGGFTSMRWRWLGPDGELHFMLIPPVSHLSPATAGLSFSFGW